MDKGDEGNIRDKGDTGNKRRVTMMTRVAIKPEDAPKMASR